MAAESGNLFAEIIEGATTAHRINQANAGADEAVRIANENFEAARSWEVYAHQLEERNQAITKEKEGWEGYANKLEIKIQDLSKEKEEQKTQINKLKEKDQEITKEKEDWRVKYIHMATNWYGVNALYKLLIAEGKACPNHDLHKLSHDGNLRKKIYEEEEITAKKFLNK